MIEREAKICEECGSPNFAGHTSGCSRLANTEPVRALDLPANVQRRSISELFLQHIEDSAERRKATEEEESIMDEQVKELGALFSGTPAHWLLDGAINISIARGEYIGVHKDIDVSVDPDDLEDLETHFLKKGYGLFIAEKDPESLEHKLMRRVHAEEFREAAALDQETHHPMIVKIDTNGSIDSEARLTYIDTHILSKDQAGRPIHGPFVLPEAWNEPQWKDIQGERIATSHPGRIIFFKLLSGRNYDLTDIDQLVDTGCVTEQIVDEIESVFRSIIDGQQEKTRIFFSEIAKEVDVNKSEKELLTFFQEHALTGMRARQAPERFNRMIDRLKGMKEPTAEQVLDVFLDEFAVDLSFKDTLSQLDHVRQKIHLSHV